MVIFVQGCSQKCPGCFNPETHSFNDVNLYYPEDILKQHLRLGVTGLTISGGEPFSQAEGLLHLLKTAKVDYNLSTIVYSGFTYEKLKETHKYQLCFQYIDLLVDGKFEESHKEIALLARGSTNQKFHFLTDCIKDKDLYLPARVEILIGKDGTITKTGFSKI